MRRLLLFLALVVFVGIFAEGSVAQDRVVRPAFEALAPEAQARVVPEDPLARFRTQAVPGGRVDLDDGVLRAAYRIGRRVPQAATPEAMARTYLDAEAARFGWSDAADLELKAVTTGRYSTHLTFQQTFSGLPVYNRMIKVNLNRDGQPTMVLSGYAPHLARLGAFNPNPSLSASAAAARAQEVVSQNGARTTTPELVVYPEQTPRLAWRVVAWPNSLPAEWEVLLDARTGDVIHLLDLSTHSHGERVSGRKGERERSMASTKTAPPASTAGTSLTRQSKIQNPKSKIVDGTGLVFDPDPLTTAGVEYGVPYIDANDTDVQELNDERIEVTLFDITLGTDGLYRLEGPFVTIDGAAQLGGTGWDPPAEADPNAFQYGRANDFFEAVMAYYHVDKSQRYVQSLDVGRAIQETPVRVNPHGLGTADDSRYYPVFNGMGFGDGGIDDAEDADVIWHEYGHALLQSSAPGLLNNDEGRALHEGWSDYWAASYSRGLIDAGKVPDHDWRKVFTWDGNEFWSGRRLDRAGRYPEDTRCDDGSCRTVDWYTDGLLWATTLMELYDELGREVIDRLCLASHGYLSPPGSFADAAEAIIQADLDLYGGQHLGVIIDRLGARGYVDPTAFGPILAHEPLPHIEDEGSTVTFTADALTVGAPVASVLVFYSIDGGSFEALELDAQGGGRYEGTLPLPSMAAEINYYLEAADETGLRSVLPSGAPTTTFSFGVGPDTEAPLIAHVPIEQVALQAWPPRVVAEVADNQGIDSVWVSYSVIQAGTPVAEGIFSLVPEAEGYAGVFPVLPGALRAGTTVRYRIHALDVARNANEALLPASGTPAFEIAIVVQGVLATFDFEGDQTLAATGSWVRGVPGYGVQVAHSGQNVWATNTVGPYPAVEQSATLDLPPFNLGDFSEAFLILWHWYDFEHSGILEPGPSTSGALWDGGNVKVSTNDGISWVVVDPLGGYTGTLEQGTGNPISGQRAFGGYSFGWRRVIVPLPSEDNVRVRFEFGTDGSNDLASEFYAGWYLDDVRVVTEVPQDATPPAFVATPPAVVQADAGRVPPPLIVEATDDTGLEAVLAEYEIIPASGSRQQGTLRLAMTPNDLNTFIGAIAAEAPLGVGDQIEYRFRLRDFDGNTAVLPAVGQTPFRIEYRLSESVSALRNVRASGLWRPLQGGYTASTTEDLTEVVSSLVLEPIDLPANTDVITFSLAHTYRFSSDIGGNLKISLDEGLTWTVLEPEGGYGATYEPEGGHPMQGERVFAGQTGSAHQAMFDLVEFAGRQVRLRLDLAAPRSLFPAEFWTISEAALAFSTLEQAFDIPRELALHANFPDPFLESTTISFTLPEAMPVRLELYNILGQRIAVLVDGQQDAGTHTLTMGRGGLAAGIYLMRMMAGGTQHVERMVITR